MSAHLSIAESKLAPVFIVGATGTGKSTAAMEWARACGGAILAMDAMQVYRGADIGTSKPSAAERAEIVHGGLDLVDLGKAFDVAQYLAHAAEFLREQREAGRRVIIVGGTGLYFRALTRGLCEAPQGSQELRGELSSLSVPELQSRLKAVDPAMLEQIDAANPRRLARAIEVMESTGKSLRAWQEATPEPLVRDFKAIWIQREKTELESRIEARVKAMFAQGWLEEVRALISQHGIEAMRKFAGIGYREIAEAMELSGQLRSQTPAEGAFWNEESEVAAAVPSGGQSSRQKTPSLGTAAGTSKTLRRDISMATRQYAKRQLTWFAREPNLFPVMLTGNQSCSEAMRAAGTPDLL